MPPVDEIYPTKTINLLTKGNVTLRRLAPADAAPLAALANNKKIWDNVRDHLPFPYSVGDAKAFIQLTAKEETPVTFGIAYGSDFCGVIGLVPQTDVYRLSAEIGYWIGEPFWGKGIATTAVGLLTEYGFGKLKLVRIYSGVFHFNTASMKVLEKNGYAKEGVFAKAVVKNGRLCDEHRYAVTSEVDGLPPAVGR